MKVETQVRSMNSQELMVFLTHLASNMLLKMIATLTAVQLSNAKTALGHHVPRDKLAKISAGLSSTKSITPRTTMNFQVLRK